jgi:hypothetical protein
MGYAGTSPSVAVEFDIYTNPEYADPNANHIGIDINGSMVSVAVGVDPVGAGVSLKSGAVFHAWVDYDGATLRVSVAPDVASRPAPVVEYPLTLPFANAYVGFTAATGAGYANHDIRSWGFDVSQDTDGDGLPDSWEVVGIPTGEGSAPFALPGADPMHKDVYVEIDAMTGVAPSADELQRVVAAFQQSLVPNPDGQDGIRLHITGEGCDPCVDEADLVAVDWSYPPWDAVHEIKIAHFGTTGERGNQALLEAKARAFRYCVFGGMFDAAGHSGVCEGTGHDFVVTLGAFVNATPEMRAGTFMHELGHSLGLGHGGVDAVSFKPNYYSVMNYTWQWPISVSPNTRKDLEKYRNSWKLDYSGSRLNDLDESRLNELNGIGGVQTAWVPVGPPRGTLKKRLMLVPMGGTVDWNGDGIINNAAVARDIDFLDLGANASPSPGENLVAYDDWANLRYQPTESFPPTVTPVNRSSAVPDSVDEMTPAIYDSLGTLEFDCNNTGMADHEEIANGSALDTDNDGIPDACENLPVTGVAVDGATSVASLVITSLPGGTAHEIRFTLARAGQAMASIYDVQGRRVKSLLGRSMGPGMYRVTWLHTDDRGLAVSSGVYFVELRSGDRRLHGKIVVLK